MKMLVLNVRMPSIFKLEFKWFILTDKNGYAPETMEKQHFKGNDLPWTNYYFDRKKWKFCFQCWNGCMQCAHKMTHVPRRYRNVLFWYRWKCCSTHLFSSWKNVHIHNTRARVAATWSLWHSPTLRECQCQITPLSISIHKIQKFTQFLLSLDTIYAHFTCYFNFLICAFIGCLRSIMCVFTFSVCL